MAFYRPHHGIEAGTAMLLVFYERRLLRLFYPDRWGDLAAYSYGLPCSETLSRVEAILRSKGSQIDWPEWFQQLADRTTHDDLDMVLVEMPPEFDNADAFFQHVAATA